MRLLLQQREEVGEDVAGDDLVAFGGGVGTVGLHHAVYAVDVLEEEGQDGDVELVGDGGVVGGELLDVVGAVVRRQGDAGEDDLDAAGLEGLDDLGEVVVGGLRLETAESVVAAKLDD